MNSYLKVALYNVFLISSLILRFIIVKLFLATSEQLSEFFSKIAFIVVLSPFVLAGTNYFVSARLPLFFHRPGPDNTNVFSLFAVLNYVVFSVATLFFVFYYIWEDLFLLAFAIAFSNVGVAILHVFGRSKSYFIATMFYFVEIVILLVYLAGYYGLSFGLGDYAIFIFFLYICLNVFMHVVGWNEVKGLRKLSLLEFRSVLSGSFKILAQNSTNLFRESVDLLLINVMPVFGVASRFDYFNVIYTSNLLKAVVSMVAGNIALLAAKDSLSWDWIMRWIDRLKGYLLILSFVTSIFILFLTNFGFYSQVGVRSIIILLSLLVLLKNAQSAQGNYLYSRMLIRDFFYFSLFFIICLIMLLLLPVGADLYVLLFSGFVLLAYEILKVRFEINHL